MAKYFEKPFAISGDKSPVTDDSISSIVSYETGYTPAYELDPNTDPDGLFIDRQRFNQIMFDVTSNIKEWQEKTFPAFIADDGSGNPFSYPIGAIVNLAGVNYQAIVDGTTTTPPSAEFAVFSAVGFQQYGLGTSDGALYQEEDDANNLVKGGFFYLTSTAANLPAAGNWLVTVSIGADANNVHQVAVSDADGTLLYVRSRVAGAWGGWASSAPLGSGQTWQNVSGSRTSGVTYTNTTGKAIYVAFFVDNATSNNISALIDGSVKLGFLLSNHTSNDVASLSFIVPAGQTYSITDNGPNNERLWYELR